MLVEAEGGTWYLVGKTSWLRQASGLRAFLPENHIQLRIMALLNVTYLLWIGQLVATHNNKVEALHMDPI